MDRDFFVVEPSEVYDQFPNYIHALCSPDLPHARQRAMFGVFWYHIRTSLQGSESFTWAVGKQNPRRAARDLILKREALVVLDTSHILRDTSHPAPTKLEGDWAYRMWILKWLAQHRETLEDDLAEQMAYRGLRKR